MKRYIIGFLLIIAFIVLQMNNEYMESKSRRCVVDSKMITQHETKHGLEDNLTLILISEHQKFDLEVSASTYSGAKKGDILFFNLRQFDIKQNHIDNNIYFIGMVILLTINLVYIPVMLVFAYKDIGKFILDKLYVYAAIKEKTDKLNKNYNSLLT